MKQDFIVIGAGIVGLATAERLLLEGAAVTVLERGEVGRESSWAGGGILSPLCPWDYAEEVTRLTTRGAALFPAWAQALFAATGIDPEYQVSGMMVLPPFDLQAARQWCAAQQLTLNPDIALGRHTGEGRYPAMKNTPRSGQNHDVVPLAPAGGTPKVGNPPPTFGWAELTPPWLYGAEAPTTHAAWEIFNYLDSGLAGGRFILSLSKGRNDVVFSNGQSGLNQASAVEHAGLVSEQALYLPQVAQVRNPQLLRALCSRVEALGGHIVEHCPVQNIVAENGRVQALATSGGIFSATGYIVSAGAWSKEVLGQHALQLDIKPVRGQMLLFKFPEPPVRSIILQGDLYMIPRRDGYLLVGSTLEDVGFDKQTTIAARDDLSQRAQRILPQLRHMPVVQQWAGLRPAAPRNIPTIGRHPRLDNLYLNSGHFRYGVTMAPASAEILLNEIIGSTQPFDVTPYQAGWTSRMG